MIFQEVEEGTKIRRRTWRDKLHERLCPWTPIVRRDPEPRTYITTDVRCHFDWKDRLRLLFTGTVRMTLHTYTDVEVKTAETDTFVNVGW